MFWDTLFLEAPQLIMNPFVNIMKENDQTQENWLKLQTNGTLKPSFQNDERVIES